MSAICNYSHPEQQITEGMIRHPTGSLFPYNPEFYELASSLYGPGAIYCWLLLLTSVILTWIYHLISSDDKKGPGMSNDLWAVLAYPAFAATDALVQAMKLRGTEHRALAYFCLRFPGVQLDVFAKFNHTQLDLRDIPPDIVRLGQGVINLSGPVSVCYMFTTVFAILHIVIAVATLAEGPKADSIMDFFVPEPADPNRSWWRRTRFGSTSWVVALVWLTLGYVFFILTILILSFGDFGISLFINLYEGMTPSLLLFTLAMALPIAVALVLGCIKIGISCMQRRWKECWMSLKQLTACLVGALFPGFCIFASYINQMRVVPDLAISVTEKDQLATLIVGIATLGYTAYDIYHRRLSGALEEEEATELLQPPASDA